MFNEKEYLKETCDKLFSEFLVNPVSNEEGNVDYSEAKEYLDD